MISSLHGESSVHRSRRLTSGFLLALGLVLAVGLLVVVRADAGLRGVPVASPSVQASRHATTAAPGEVLVRLKPGASKSSVNALAGSLGASKVRDLDVSAIVPKGVRILLIKSSTLSGEALVKSALQTANVAEASLNYKRTIDAAVYPNDPFFSSLWGMENTGQTGGTAGADISAPEAWSTTTGSAGVVVAGVDTGVAYDHEDLAANMWNNPGEIPANGIDDDSNGYIDDVHGIDAVTATPIRTTTTGTVPTPPARWPVSATTASASPAWPGRHASWR
jgi:subtilisin family serine protease